MRQVKEILRLKFFNQLSVREVARSCGLPVSTVGDYIQRAEAAGLGWPWPEGMADSESQMRLLGNSAESAAPAREVPPWPQIHEQLRRKGVTLYLLWQEYRRGHADGFQYSRFCELYRQWAGTLEPVLRLPHEPAYAGARTIFQMSRPSIQWEVGHLLSKVKINREYVFNAN